MNYKQIAEKVHELVKNPKEMEYRNLLLSSGSQKTNESIIISKVFTKLELSSDSVSFIADPFGIWG